MCIRDRVYKLRMIARKTWKYFDEFVGPEDNWLTPDNYQEEPHVGIAHRTSPTNIGLALMSTLTARDLGYISTTQAIERFENTISTLKRMEKWNGHYYNWYNTRTLEPLKPRYVSSVDSGNLACYLILLKQGIGELLSRPLIGREMALGPVSYTHLVSGVKILNIEEHTPIIPGYILPPTVDSQPLICLLYTSLEPIGKHWGLYGQADRTI